MQLIDPKCALIGRSSYVKLEISTISTSLIKGAAFGVLALAFLAICMMLGTVLSDGLPRVDSVIFSELPIIGFQLVTKLFVAALFFFLIFACALLLFGGPLLWIANVAKVRGWLTAATIGAATPNLVLLALNGFSNVGLGLICFSAAWGMLVGLYIWYIAYERPYRKAAKTG